MKLSVSILLFVLISTHPFQGLSCPEEKTKLPHPKLTPAPKPPSPTPVPSPTPTPSPSITPSSGFLDYNPL